MKKILLRVFAPVLLVVLYVLCFLPRKYLVVSYQETGEVICVSQVKSGSAVEVALTHSFEHVPWNEYYIVTDADEFLLEKITVAGYGAGIPAEMDVTTRMEDGLVIMEDINSVFPKFSWITSQTNMKTLTVDGRVILSFDSIPNHSFVEAAVQKKRGMLFLWLN